MRSPHMTVVAVAESPSSCFASSSASCNSGSVDSMNTKVDTKMTPSETNAATFKQLKYWSIFLSASSADLGKEICVMCVAKGSKSHCR